MSSLSNLGFPYVSPITEAEERELSLFDSESAAIQENVRLAAEDLKDNQAFSEGGKENLFRPQLRGICVCGRPTLVNLITCTPLCFVWDRENDPDGVEVRASIDAFLEGRTSFAIRSR